MAAMPTDPSATPVWAEKLAQVSRPYLLRLQAMPRAVLLVATMVILALGLFLPGVAGAFFLSLIGLFMLWLALLAWPILGPGPRAIRVGVAVFILFLAVIRALSAF